ncbi:MAG: electron transfer flavoprotein subunit beta/FixA family protein [Sporolactobacillus sp.]
MKILVCYKWVLDESDITVDSDGKALNTRRAKAKISEIDRNALELGTTLKTDGGELVALTAGKDVKASVKEVLSRGADAAYYIETGEKAESSVAARLLSRAIQKLGPFDVIICGEGSSDEYSQQVGPRLAGLLGYHLITYASAVEKQGDQLTVTRKLENGIETIGVSSPVVLTVVSELNDPKVPGMKQILSARKKPSKELNAESLELSQIDTASSVKTILVGPSIMERKRIRLNDGDTPVQKSVEQLVQRLKEEKII